jgi:hypothetical protein
MIGNANKNVVAFKNFSSSCGCCHRHLKAEAKKAEDDQATNDTTNDIPMPPPTTSVPKHFCPKHYSGSSKGMEAKAALDCVEQVWSHKEVSAFISIICIDDDATTKAYLQHSFADLLAKQLPRPLNKKGEPKSGKVNDKGKLQKDHPVIKFLADLSHRVRSFSKYLYALKNVSKSESEMTDIDCLRLKRNYAWWLFSGVNLTYEEFKQSAASPVFHHFNDHSLCGTWCKHTKKTEEELKKLK